MINGITIFREHFRNFKDQYTQNYSKLNEKWPAKAERVYDLYRQLDIRFCKSAAERQGELRDKKDIPVLSDALYYKVDIILSGDKVFLEADLERPLVYSPAMMLEYLEMLYDK